VVPAESAKAYEAIRGSVVHVRGSSPVEIDKTPGKAKDSNKSHDKSKGQEEHAVEGIGTGVVIVDKGIILTNLHVVNGFQRIVVTFADGSESEAFVMSTAPEHDLAVLRAMTVPDDLPAATLRSTADLAPGDHVIAVGFPFGIGPSV